MKCPKCGTFLKDGQMVCPVCGFRVEEWVSSKLYSVLTSQLQPQGLKEANLLLHGIKYRIIPPMIFVEKPTEGAASPSLPKKSPGVYKKSKREIIAIFWAILALLLSLLAILEVTRLLREKSKIKYTVAALRNIATAIDVYILDNGSPPKAEDIYELKNILKVHGLYIQNMPTEDAWGNPFHYEYDKKHYTICSYGKDGVRGSENGLYPPPSTPEDADRDICYKDGQLIIGPSNF